MSEESDNDWEVFMRVDLVEVEVSGPDPEAVEEQFEEAVEEAFKRYDEHVAGDAQEELPYE